MSRVSERPWKSWKSPSKLRHDGQRSHRRDLIFNERRQERLRLFGYVKLKNGEITTIDDASKRLADGIRAEKEERKIPNAITQDQIEEWYQPESFRDTLNSIGEVDAMHEYPGLGIEKGTVLKDPKLRHVDHALRE